jgi:hypothetical protein
MAGPGRSAQARNREVRMTTGTLDRDLGVLVPFNP